MGAGSSWKRTGPWPQRHCTRAGALEAVQETKAQRGAACPSARHCQGQSLGLKRRPANPEPTHLAALAGSAPTCGWHLNPGRGGCVVSKNRRGGSARLRKAQLWRCPFPEALLTTVSGWEGPNPGITQYRAGRREDRSQGLSVSQPPPRCRSPFTGSHPASLSLSAFQTHHAVQCSRAFAQAVPSARNVPPTSLCLPSKLLLLFQNSPRRYLLRCFPPLCHSLHTPAPKCTHQVTLNVTWKMPTKPGSGRHQFRHLVI